VLESAWRPLASEPLEKEPPESIDGELWEASLRGEKPSPERVVSALVPSF
jgi:hypothetical protein